MTIFPCNISACTQMMEGKFLIFKCIWIRSYQKIKNFWREFGRTDVCFPQMRNMHLFPRNLNNNSKAVTQTSCVVVVFFFLQMVLIFIQRNKGEKATMDVSKWSNEMHSYQWNLNGLQDEILFYTNLPKCTWKPYKSLPY